MELLRREKEAECEVALLRRELELLRASSMPRAEVEVECPHREERRWRDVKDMIGEFDESGRDDDSWERQLRSLVNTYRFNKLGAKALLCNRLKDRALKWYQLKSDAVEKSSCEILTEMRAIFDLRPSKLQRKREFEQRQWKPKESFVEYVHDKVTLGNNGVDRKRRNC